MAARTLSLYALLLTFVLALGACKKDDFAIETVAELRKLADDIKAKVETGDDRKAGVDAAQQLLDERRPELVIKMQEVATLRSGQISEDTAAHVNRVRSEAALTVTGLGLALVSQAATDPELGKKITKLNGDFTRLVDGE